MRVAIVGCGAIGGVLGVHAARAGAEVELCSRRPFARLVVESAEGELALSQPARTDPAAGTPADWVILATKQHQTAAAAPWLARVCGPRTRGVLVAQNGVEHEQTVGPLVGGVPIVPSVVQIAAELLAPGRIRHHGFGRLAVPSGAPGKELAELFAGSAVTIAQTDDFTTAAWQKLCGNCFANPITALTGRRLEVLRRDDVGALARGLIRECVAVGRREGAALPDDLPERLLAGLRGIPDGTGSSMLHDRLAGRALEHDALNGAVVRIGERHGVPTPLNRAVLALLAAISERAPS